MTPPATGPSQYTQWSVQVALTRAGPNVRAGFMEAPVKGTPTRWSMSTTKPIPNPAMNRKLPSLRGPISMNAGPSRSMASWFHSSISTMRQRPSMFMGLVSSHAAQAR